MVQHTQVNQCDKAHQQKKRWKPHDHLSDAADRIQHPFMIKTLTKVGTVGTYLIKLSSEKLKAFPLKSGTGQHSTGRPSHSSQTKTRFPNWKGSGKIVIICR